MTLILSRPFNGENFKSIAPLVVLEFLDYSVYQLEMCVLQTENKFLLKIKLLDKSDVFAKSEVNLSITIAKMADFRFWSVKYTINRLPNLSTVCSKALS